MREKGVLLLAGLMTIALSGCGTMRSGTYDKVTIVSNIEGAHCKLYRDGEGYLKAITTPGRQIHPPQRQTALHRLLQSGLRNVQNGSDSGKAGNNQHDSRQRFRPRHRNRP